MHPQTPHMLWLEFSLTYSKLWRIFYNITKEKRGLMSCNCNETTHHSSTQDVYGTHIPFGHGQKPKVMDEMLFCMHNKNTKLPLLEVLFLFDDRPTTRMLHCNINTTKNNWINLTNARCKRVVEEHALGLKHADVIQSLFLFGPLYMVGVWFNEDQRDWTTSSNFTNWSTIERTIFFSVRELRIMHFL